MSAARKAVKESMLVAADQYEADGEWWRADALRALARGDVLEVEVMPRSYGSREMRLRLRLNAADEWARSQPRPMLTGVPGPGVRRG